ncbi:hypothetical protein O3M35_002048 [Rhynocoris fuscipes]|uniref:Lysophospholipid acyltransferase 7 n=1 Tax=Rhynocoris fuscipes TaxID=488301 RepID=A0AAW1CSX9_9HEMI
MEWDDIVYLLLLFSSIGFGKYFRNIEDKNIKRNVASLVGSVIILIASGYHFWHPLIFILANAIIIKCLSKKIIHKVSFAFSFAYLFFFRNTILFGIPYPPAHLNLIQMIMTLKLIGLAFELHDTNKGLKEERKDAEFEAMKIPEPSFSDIVHYSLCYVGVLTGPYFSYRMYLDMLNTPFGKYVNCWDQTIERVKLIPLYVVIFLALNKYFPFDYALTDEFYNERSLGFRLWYVLPLFGQFKTRMYIGMRLSEAVFTMSGLGAYPAETTPLPGKGPSKDHQLLEIIANDEEKAKNTKYSYRGIHNIEPYGAEFDYTVRQAMKSWNMTVQYWLAAYVYKRFPYKAYRVFATFIVSAVWHGMYAGYYCCICSVPLYLPIEDIYYKNLKDIKVSPPVSWIWFMVVYWWRMFLMGYWGITFRLLTLSACFKYWSSVYFIPTLITLVMLAVSFVIFPKPKRTDRPAQDKKIK